MTSDWDWQSLAFWLVGHAGAVVTATMVVLAWLQRRGSSHLRGLRVRVRYRGVDCLRWAAAPWFCMSRAYWLLRYPRDWEIARTLREGLQAAGISLHDGAFRRQLSREIHLARQAGVLQKFEQTPDSTEVRTPIEDRAVECRILEDIAAESDARGWTVLATTLRAAVPGAADPLAFQTICDIWLRTTQPMLLDVVFRQIDKAVCQLRQVNGTVEEIRAESKQTTATVAAIRTESRQTTAAVAELRQDFAQVSKATATAGEQASRAHADGTTAYHQTLLETHRLARRAMLFALLTFLALTGTLAYLVVRYEFLARPS